MVEREQVGEQGESRTVGAGKRGGRGKENGKGQYGTGPGLDVLSHFPQFISENAV